MRKPPDRPVVLADVARLAETSEATASRALQDDPRIGEATRAAVQAAAQKLGYVPNAAARSLRARRTHILGLLLDDLADPVHGQVAAGFEAAAADQGYAVFIMTGLRDVGREERALRAFVEHRADGIVLASCVSDPSDVYRLVAPQRVVFVQPAYPSLSDGASAPLRGVLRTDDAAGVAATVAHLVERGYRRIAYVGAGGTPSDVHRGSTVRTTLAALSLEPAAMLDAGSGGWRDASGIASQLAARPPDAVICYDDKLALALLDALRSTGVDVPDDLAVAGFDGTSVARLARPRLTTVAVPSVELGRRAVEMLLAAHQDGQMAVSEVLPVSLVIGESTPVRAAAVLSVRTSAVVAGAGTGSRR